MNPSTTAYAPKGFQDVTPYLISSHASRLIDFLRAAFDATEVMIMKGEGDKISHAAFRIGNSNIELADAQGPWQPMNAGLHVYVPDVDATYDRAIKAGGESLYEPKDMFYGERSGGVKDPSGNHWYIATVTEELTAEEMHRRAATAGCAS